MNMPRGQPFTRLCRAMAEAPRAARADLHVHSTCSDGTYLPEQLVDLARRCGLSALAVTDHDTFDGFFTAKRFAPSSLEIIPGVEITCTHRERELHLLAYYFDTANEALRAALADLRTSRDERFREMVARLNDLGIPLRWNPPSKDAAVSLGRRHLAELLVHQGHAADVQDAFRRYLGDHGRLQVPKRRLPVAEAIVLVRRAGGVTSWAHPPQTTRKEDLADLHSMGLQAVEVGFPACRPGRSRQLRGWAAELGLAVTAGSDCHGPEPVRRALGSITASSAELESLRAMAVSDVTVQ